jgi:predicted N-acetyltransferase YhbS
MLIRNATEADLAGVSACLAEAFEPYRDRYTPAGFTDTVLTVETARRRLEHMTILVAVAEGAIAGTIGYHAGTDGEGHVRGMAVRAPAQGSGIARALLAAAEAALRAHGCTRVTLERAIAFYERHGYTATGVIRDFYGMELIEYEKALPPA